MGCSCLFGGGDLACAKECCAVLNPAAPLVDVQYGLPTAASTHFLKTFHLLLKGYSCGVVDVQYVMLKQQQITSFHVSSAAAGWWMCSM